MLKKTIAYKDFNDEEVSEDFFFHLSKAELVELELSHDGGLEAAIRRISAANDGKAIIAEFKNIILSSYGQRSEDGRRFIKNQTLRDEFESSEAYSTLFMELVTDADKAAEFVRGVIPQDLAAETARVVPSPPELAPAPAEEVREVTRAQMMEMSKEEFDEVNLEIMAGRAKIVE